MVHSEKLCRKQPAQRAAHCFLLKSIGAGRGEQGQSLIQLVAVLAIAMILFALALPNLNQTIRVQRLRTAAGDLSSLAQKTRMLATKNNATYPIVFCAAVACGATNGVPIVYADLNGNGTWDIATEPVVYFSNRVFPAPGAPPAPYVLVGDTGGAFPAGTNLGYNARGLPCAYNAGPPVVCTTPAAQYFVFYLNDNQATPGWAAMIVTKGGRSKVSVWNGAAWGM